MQVKVKTRWEKTSPDKIRNVIDVIRGLPATLALAKLKIINKQATKPVLHLLKASLAAAKEEEFNEDNIYISQIYCNEGPKLKRRHYKARGRASVIQKRMSHLTLVLSDKKEK